MTTYRAPWGRYELVREGVMASLDRPNSYLIASVNGGFPAELWKEAGSGDDLVTSWLVEVNAFSTEYMKDPKPWPSSTSTSGCPTAASR